MGLVLEVRHLALIQGISETHVSSKSVEHGPSNQRRAATAVGQNNARYASMSRGGDDHR